jgi:thioredoxin 1
MEGALREVSDAILHVTDESFQAEVTDSKLPVVLDFWAPWCGPCRAMEPVLEDVAREYAGKIVVGKLNVDECPDTAMRYDILSIPTLLFVKDGEVVKKLVGSLPKKAIVSELAPWL